MDRWLSTKPEIFWLHSMTCAFLSLVSCLLYVLAVATSSRWKSPVQHQKAFWPSCFRGCRRYGGYEHAVRTGHQPANSWETKGVYDNDFTTSIKISLVRRYYFICTPFLPPVDLYPCTLDMLTFSGDLFFYLLTDINLSCSAILLYSVYRLRQKSRSSPLLLPYWRWVQPWLSVLTSSRTRSRTKLKVFKTNFKAWLRKKISLSFICYVTILTLRLFYLFRPTWLRIKAWVCHKSFTSR